jgi:intracellular multiplication protein IcmE
MLDILFLALVAYACVVVACHVIGFACYVFAHVIDFALAARLVFARVIDACICHALSALRHIRLALFDGVKSLAIPICVLFACMFVYVGLCCFFVRICRKDWFGGTAVPFVKFARWIDLRAERYVSYKLLRVGYSLRQLRSAGSHLTLTPKELRDEGFSARELKEAGFDSARELKEAGFSGLDLESAGFSWFVDLRLQKGLEGGILHKKIRAEPTDKIGAVVVGKMKKACRILKEDREGDLQVLDRERTVHDCGLQAVGSQPHTLAVVLVNPREFYQLYTVRELWAHGYTSYTLHELCGFGYTYSDLRAAGFTANDLKEGLGCALEELKRAGYLARDLKIAGYSFAQLHQVGFSTSELAKAGCPARCLKDVGYTAAQLSGCYSLVQLKESFTLEELKRAGYLARNLKTAGYSFAQLHQVGFSISELAESGCPARYLKDVGYTAAQLSGYYSCAQLHQVGFNASDLKEAGFSGRQLREMRDSLGHASISYRELVRAGFTPMELLPDTCGPQFIFQCLGDVGRMLC